ncbi:phosphocholine-specific phospholipase C [Kutzneria kofuensis]|uniref:phospholipase C n=1 Tax=Kutzneria kofuensis TaxID=103725 RepID=A0A7W9KIX6_9PSEU|nr:phospholipase C, phosphocholine-specific [Kutzneria kofuensis]MBB5893118.1 phospholipase C [Kutzneria kofuensis]
MADSNSPLTRRRFLGTAAGTVAAAGALAALPPGMAEALAEPRRRGRISDVEHVVVLMQENRSFDHYYGSMRGVRGFGDRTAVIQPNGKDIFHQYDLARTDGNHLLPFHVDTSKVDGQDLGDLGHGWDDQHLAMNNGANNSWITAKGEMTMGYFTERDIPFHRALADAFTLCDAYHCSVQGPTTPNRLYLFTGTIDADGKYGGPVNYNPADYKGVLRWTTYPERLQDAGVSWKVYANKEVGDDGAHPFVGDYGDNPLWLFEQYHHDYDSELSKRASVFKTWEPDSGKGKDVNHVLSEFIADCAAGTLPKVSWIVAPYGYCEHPEARPVDGAAYTQTVLNALWANKTLWDNTVVLIDYDENDGFFDHVPPPMAPAGTPGEFIGGKSIGLGARVPMTVISPWSRGGWVNSEVSDHTSVIRFLEQWTGVREPNITDWRRAICGDLTSCFDFGAKNVTIPLLPDTAQLRKIADDTQTKLPKPTPPATGKQVTPLQDQGTRPARPLPYQPAVTTSLSADKGTLTTTFANYGTGQLQLWAFRADGKLDGPWQYDVPAGKQVSDTWKIWSYGYKYNVAVHGPNRFLWQFAADVNKAGAIDAVAGYTADFKLKLTLANPSAAAVKFTVTTNHYGNGKQTFTVAAGKTVDHIFTPTEGWYDVSVTIDADPVFLRRYTGHVENGHPSVTG